MVEDCLQLSRVAAQASQRSVVFSSTFRSFAPARISVIRRVMQEHVEHAVRTQPECRTISVSMSETETTLRLEVRAENLEFPPSGESLFRISPNSMTCRAR